MQNSMVFISNGNIKTKISIFEHIASSKICGSSIKETKIMTNVYLINYTTYTRTDEYLKTKKKFIFLNFDEENKCFKCEVRLAKRISLIECIMFVHIVVFWLKLGHENIVIVRTTHRNVLSFFLNCLMRYIQDCTFEKAYNTIKNTVKQIEMPKKLHQMYFNNYLNNNEFRVLNLHQIVISTLPKKKLENSKPFGRPFYSLRIIEKPTISTVINDENHIICKVDTAVSGDITLVINKNNVKLFSLFLNTNSFEEGLYRFKKEDLTVENGTVLDDNFSMDIVFFGTTKNSKLYNFDAKFLLVEKYVGAYNIDLVNKLKGDGHNDVDAKIMAILAESSDKTKIVQKMREEKNKETQLVIETYLDRPFKPNDNVKLEHIDLIVDILPEKTRNGKKKKRVPAKSVYEARAQNSLLIRPFYWAIIPKTCDSIFNELDDVHTQIDFSKFEDWFCINSESHQLKIEKQSSKVIKDNRRLFLISLSLKTFEKKKINLQENELIKLPLEDLLTINAIIPTDEEYKLLLSNENELLEIEKKMLPFYSFKKLTKLLIFERKFFENKDKWMMGIENIKSVFDTILQSNNIRLLLKTVLEIGNAINTSYGNSRKKASAFKMSSLALVKNYKGKRADQSLIKFVAETARSRIKSIKRDIETIKLIRDDELCNYKEIVNEYISEYRLYKDWVNELDEVSRAYMKACLFYFSLFVKNFSCEYREALIYSSVVKRKFGESEDKNVRDIITTLYDFLRSIQQEIEG